MCFSSQLHFTNHHCGEVEAGISSGLSRNIQSKKERNEYIHVQLLAQPSSLIQFRRQLGFGFSYSRLDLLTSISFIKTIPQCNVDNSSWNKSPLEILKLYCVELVIKCNHKGSWSTVPQAQRAAHSRQCVSGRIFS